VVRIYRVEHRRGLVRRKEKVRVLDSFITGKMENIAPFLKKIELVKGDIRDRAALRKGPERHRLRYPSGGAAFRPEIGRRSFYDKRYQCDRYAQRTV